MKMCEKDIDESRELKKIWLKGGNKKVKRSMKMVMDEKKRKN